MTKTNSIHPLVERISQRFGDAVYCSEDIAEVTLELSRDQLLEVCRALRDEVELSFKQLIDVTGVDYQGYGEVEWSTRGSSSSGFSRGVQERHRVVQTKNENRFAVVYHLLSIRNNQRLRLRVFADNDYPVVPSVTDLWASANWYEREVFDLFGILFDGHPDLRRILTDYGFIGHPFRKDFPLIGQVEMRYDPERKRVIYQPVSIDPRVLVPRVIRDERERSHEAVDEICNEASHAAEQDK